MAEIPPVPEQYKGLMEEMRKSGFEVFAVNAKMTVMQNELKANQDIARTMRAN